ncbi:hypothetical protein IRJ41_014330, partial [Triplophysa rosa]
RARPQSSFDLKESKQKVCVCESECVRLRCVNHTKCRRNSLVFTTRQTFRGSESDSM